MSLLARDWATLTLRARQRAVDALRSNELGRLVHEKIRDIDVRQHSAFDTIYHCCTARSGGAWVRACLDDPIVWRWCGLRVVPFEAPGPRLALTVEPFPDRSIAAHVNVGYRAYAESPKPTAHRTFFVMRDARDIVVSTYFLGRFGQGLDGHPAAQLRPLLQGLPKEDGMIAVVDRLREWGIFDALRSWAVKGKADPAVRLFRYEQIADAPEAFLADLFDWLDIPVPGRDIELLARRHSFKAHAGGREQGMEDTTSTWRKGVAGDWRQHFSGRCAAHFRTVVGNLLEVLGYPA
jgi:hypothetical protein